MFYKGSGGLKSMFFEAISAAQKSEEKHEGMFISQNHNFTDTLQAYSTYFIQLYLNRVK